MSRADLSQSDTGSKLRCRASDVEFTLRSKPVLVDFTGTCLVTAEGDGPGPVRLSGLRLVAELPDAGGREDGGTITLEQSGDGGVLHPGKSGARFEDDLVIGLGATVEQPGGVVHATARDEVRFTTAGASCPSGDGEYELAGPVDLILADTPEVTVARIDRLVLRAEPA